MLPRHLGDLSSAAQPDLSPDGKTVAFAVTRIDLGANVYRSAVWTALSDGSRPAEPLTGGDTNVTEPRWSPDGRTLAVAVQTIDGRRHRLDLLPYGRAGERRTLAEAAEPFIAIRWSPDGTHLAYLQRVREHRPEPGASDVDDDRSRPPRRITRFFSRLDNEGWVSDRRRHVHVVAADGTAAPVDVTPGEFEFTQVDWMPDGRTLVCAGATTETWDTDFEHHLHLVPAPVDGREHVAAVERITTGSVALVEPRLSPDGTRIAFLGIDDPLLSPQNAGLGVLEVGTRERRWIDTGIDRNWAPYPGQQPPIWLDDETLLASCEDRGNVHLYRVSLAGGAERLVGGDRNVGAFASTAGVVAFAASSFVVPGEIFAVGGGAEHRLSDCTRRFCAVAEPLPAATMTVGAHEIDVWVVLPPDFEPTARASYPALVNVHGGPFTQTGNVFFDEAQVQASAGYVVVLSNPRGSSGRDTAWGQAIAGPKGRAKGTGWGSVDADDVLAVTEAVLDRYPAIDSQRVGLLGGSYGGYLTTWLVAHDRRFAAACSERAVNNLLTEELTSDVATAFRTELGVTHLDDPDEFVRVSPMTYVRAIETPMLILHSEDDLRCPVNQAEELFVALRLLGKPVEFARFPAEGHELSRSGTPAHRIQRFDLLLDWFARHLKP